MIEVKIKQNLYFIYFYKKSVYIGFPF